MGDLFPLETHRTERWMSPQKRNPTLTILGVGHSSGSHQLHRHSDSVAAT
jgi:hypothetical protein